VSELSFDVVIPNWNGKKWLCECLKSLQRQTFRSFRVIVVDNGSTDGSVGMLREKFPEVLCLENPENTGFSAAVNQGIAAARAPWILLLNNDMEVAPDCLDNLASAARRYPDYAFFALKMVNYHERTYLDGAGEAYLRGGAGYRLGTMEFDSEHYQHDRDCFGACGGAALYRQDVFTAAGLFDEGFFAYLEDVDLNLRAVRLGLRCRYIAGAVVYHIGSASTGSKFNPTTIRLSTRNSLYVLAKNYTGKIFAAFLLPICIYQFMWLCFCIKKKMVVPYLLGLKEGFGNWSTFRRKGRQFYISHPGLLSNQSFMSILTRAEEEAILSIKERRVQNGKGNTLLNWYQSLFGG